MEVSEGPPPRPYQVIPGVNSAQTEQPRESLRTRIRPAAWKSNARVKRSADACGGPQWLDSASNWLAWHAGHRFRRSGIGHARDMAASSSSPKWNSVIHHTSQCSRAAHCVIESFTDLKEAQTISNAPWHLMLLCTLTFRGSEDPSGTGEARAAACQGSIGSPIPPHTTMHRSGLAGASPMLGAGPDAWTKLYWGLTWPAFFPTSTKNIHVPRSHVPPSDSCRVRRPLQQSSREDTNPRSDPVEPSSSHLHSGISTMEVIASPRITCVYLNSYVGKNVIVVGKVIQLRGEEATIDADGNITAYLNRVSPPCPSLIPVCSRLPLLSVL